MKRKNILIWLWSLVILVIFWIGFSIYHNYVTSTISQDIQQDIIQIQPTFNTNALEKLKDRHPVLLLIPLQAARLQLPQRYQLLRHRELFYKLRKQHLQGNHYETKYF